MIYQLLYFSIGTEQNMTEDALQEILEVSRRNNPKIGITGMLIALDNCFLQLLEGEQETVQALYEKISKDERHFKIVSIHKDLVAKRSFENWSMGFKSLTRKELNDETGYINISDEHFLEKYLVDDGQRVLRIIKRFYKVV